MASTFADLSHHQEDVTAAVDVDLAAYAAAGHDRVAFKATQGLGYTDPRFAAWWRAAGALGLARVAYHFAEAENPGLAEFDAFLAAVARAGGVGPRDRLCLDIEDDDSARSRERADAYCSEFTRRAVARGHPYGLVYSGRWYAEPANIRPDDLAPGWRQLWLSDYGPADDSAIRLPAGWVRAQVVARQYGSAVRVAGVRNPCDASRVLADWLGGTGPAPTRVEDLSTVDKPTQDYLDKQFAGIRDALGAGLGVQMYGDDPDPARDSGTHPNNLRQIRKEVGLLRAQVAAQQAVLAQVAGGAGANPAELASVFEAALRAAFAALGKHA